MVLSLYFGYMVALRLVREGKGKALSRFLFIPWGIPVYIAIPLWRAFLHGNGGRSVLTALWGWEINLMNDPLSGFLGSLLVSLWLSVPATAFVLAGHMGKTGRNILEAARLEGAGEGEISRYIYLPEIRESLFAMGVLNFIGAFKEFTLVFMMTAGGPPLVSGITDRHIVGATTTLGVFLYEIFLHSGDWGVNAAYSVLLSAIVLYIISLWIGVRNRASERYFLILTLIVLLIDRTPFLMIPLFCYIPVLLIGKEKTKWLSGAALIHIALVIWMVATRGFLEGFHPSFPLAFLHLLPRRNGSAPSLYPWKTTGILSRSLTSVYALLTLVILYMLLWISLSRISAVYIDSLWPEETTLMNFKTIFTGEAIHINFWNSFKVASVSALLIPLLIYPGAVYLMSLGNKKTMMILAVIQIIGIAGGMHTLIPLYRIFRFMGWIDSYKPLVLIYLYHGVPFSLFIMTAYLRSLPRSFHDLARVEGMSRMSYGFRILLPLSAAPIVTAAMMTFISAWNGFQAPLLFLNDEKMYTISLKLYSYIGNLGSARPVWNLFAAASIINSLIIGLIFVRIRPLASRSPVSDFEE